MITVLLFLLLSAIPYAAVAQPQCKEYNRVSIYDQVAMPNQWQMSSPNATGSLMQTGSKYSPIITSPDAETGNTPNNNGGRPGQIRTTNGWPDIPFPDPIGDALWPLALLACAYLIVRVVRRRVRS
ncbi:MAG: hypothetical protein IKS76_02025 [Paludibacteraceae bacterium]|nr:hypothetical protein [Paludibacteraceae bacterium]MBR6493243.1 hypothetical protein [Paludibacteraceae bacterium]